MARDYIFKNQLERVMIMALVLILGLNLISANALKEARVKREILIKVTPNIIALPANIEIVQVPLSAARVRSTPLRRLNNQYKAVSIERLFVVAEGSKIRTEKPKAFVSKEKQIADEGPLDLSKIFTKATKDRLETRGELKPEEIAQAEDIFLIQLEFDAESEINMASVINDYLQLPAVTYAKYVTRGK